MKKLSFVVFLSSFAVFSSICEAQEDDTFLVCNGEYTNPDSGMTTGKGENIYRLSVANKTLKSVSEDRQIDVCVPADACKSEFSETTIKIEIPYAHEYIYDRRSKKFRYSYTGGWTESYVFDARCETYDLRGRRSEADGKLAGALSNANEFSDRLRGSYPRRALTANPNRVLGGIVWVVVSINADGTYSDCSV